MQADTQYSPFPYKLSYRTGLEAVSWRCSECASHYVLPISNGRVSQGLYSRFGNTVFALCEGWEKNAEIVREIDYLVAKGKGLIRLWQASRNEIRKCEWCGSLMAPELENSEQILTRVIHGTADQPVGVEASLDTIHRGLCVSQDIFPHAYPISLICGYNKSALTIVCPQCQSAYSHSSSSDFDPYSILYSRLGNTVYMVTGWWDCVPTMKKEIEMILNACPELFGWRQAFGGGKYRPCPWCGFDFADMPYEKIGAIVNYARMVERERGKDEKVLKFDWSPEAFAKLNSPEFWHKVKPVSRWESAKKLPVRSAELLGKFLRWIFE